MRTTTTTKKSVKKNELKNYDPVYTQALYIECVKRKRTTKN